MNSVIEVIKVLIAKASELHQRERALTLESVRVCGRLYHFRAHINAGLTMDEFARRIGLTPDVYAKRAKAHQLMERFPRVRQMVESGELAITSVATLYPKLTEANEKMLLDAVAHKTKREVERLAARITGPRPACSFRRPSLRERPGPRVPPKISHRFARQNPR
jgi:hypothetical protein